MFPLREAYFKKIVFYKKHKADVQNNTLYTPREANHVGEKAIFQL